PRTASGRWLSATSTPRAVQDRLDAVFGMDGWQDCFDRLPDGSAVCRLRCQIDKATLIHGCPLPRAATIFPLFCLTAVPEDVIRTRPAAKRGGCSPGMCE